jgi:CP family cyanate transporter-like MFS transporter
VKVTPPHATRRAGAAGHPPAHPALLVVGVVVLAANLRAALTAVGPLAGEIRADTGISGGVLGLVTTLPLLAFAVLSPLAPRLARRFGIERALLASLLLELAGILLRSAGAVAALLAGTTVLGLAIAIANVLLPSLVKRHFADRAGPMTGLYSSVMGIFAALSIGLAVPLADRVGLGWRGSLASWSVLALLGALVWLPRARAGEPPAVPTRGQSGTPGPGAAEEAEAAGGPTPGASPRPEPEDSPRPTPGASPTPGVRRRALWRSRLAWQVTLFMGLQSLAYYVTVAWLPEILHDRGLSTATAGWTLSLVQLMGVATSLALPLIATRRSSQRSPAVASAVLYLVGYAGLLAGTGPLALWCVLIGLGTGASFGLALTLFALRTRDPHHTAALSGMAQSVGYLLAAGGPALFGLLHDLTGGWTVPLLGLLAVTAALVPAGLGAGRDAQVA